MVYFPFDTVIVDAPGVHARDSHLVARGGIGTIGKGVLERSGVLDFRITHSTIPPNS